MLTCTCGATCLVDEGNAETSGVLRIRTLVFELSLLAYALTQTAFLIFLHMHFLHIKIDVSGFHCNAIAMCSFELCKLRTICQPILFFVTHSSHWLLLVVALHSLYITFCFACCFNFAITGGLLRL